MKVPSYSIAKTFTAAALIESGLDLNAKVGDYLNVHDHYARRPVKSVLQHISGLPDYHALADYRADVAARKPAWARDEMFERARAIPDVEIGKFSYSNIGYALLRDILEALSGTTFFEAIDQSVFTPLGIRDVAPITDLNSWDHCPEASESVRQYDPQWVYTGMVLATPDAMARTFEGIFSGKLFDPKILLDSVKVDAPGHSFPDPGYGLGVMTDADRWVAHGGGGPGFTLFVLAYPDGSAAHCSYAVGEDNGDAPLIQECLSHLKR